MTRETGYIKCWVGNTHALRVSEGICNEGRICKNVDSTIKVLAQHVPAQLVSPQIVILNP